jgi:hypothetical protein
MRTFTIELRVDYDTPEKNDIMRNAAREAARILFTQANLIAEKRRPHIALHSSDFFEGEQEITLDDSEDQA